MKVTLLKDSEHGKAKETVDVSDARANYLIRCKVAIEYIAPKQEKKENDKPRTVRKSKAKS